MNSTSTSNQIIAEVKNLNLEFQTEVYKSWTLRDSFVEHLKQPLKSFQSKTQKLRVLKNINFNIFRGDRIGLIGVNGVGKTSLCRTLSGIYHASSGHVRVNGKMRAIFDTHAGIYPELTGRENAHLLCKFMYPEEKGIHFIEEALEFSELKEFLDTPFKTYSNGMQARLCLSVISCKPCDLLILDEVFDGADLFFKEKISNRVLNIINNSGAVIFVSHSEDQILKVCNRVLVLNNGTLCFDGAPGDAIKYYKNLL